MLCVTVVKSEDAGGAGLPPFLFQAFISALGGASSPLPDPPLPRKAAHRHDSPGRGGG